jgi:hypothetical protein
VDGNPKRYNDIVEAYAPTQYSSIVRDPNGGPLGPMDPSLMSPAYARVSSVSPKRGRWGDPYTGPQYSGVVRTVAQAAGLPFQADVRPSSSSASSSVRPSSSSPTQYSSIVWTVTLNVILSKRTSQPSTHL